MHHNLSLALLVLHGVAGAPVQPYREPTQNQLVVAGMVHTQLSGGAGVDRMVVRGAKCRVIS